MAHIGTGILVAGSLLGTVFPRRNGPCIDAVPLARERSLPMTDKTEKKQYVTPKLVRYGAVRHLTQVPTSPLYPPV
jgi:hypothetical protein